MFTVPKKSIAQRNRQYMPPPTELQRTVTMCAFWVLTFLCIQQVRGYVSTALIVSGRVAAVACVLAVVMARRNELGQFLTHSRAYAINGAITTVLPYTLFLCIAQIVPKSLPVVAAFLGIVGFIAASTLHTGSAVRMRVFVLTNAGIVTTAFIVSSNPPVFFAAFIALCIVAPVNLLVFHGSTAYANRALADVPADAAAFWTHLCAIGYLLPLLTWYANRWPPTPFHWCVVAGIWIGAIMIRLVLRSTVPARAAATVAVLTTPLSLVLMVLTDSEGKTLWLQRAVLVLWVWTVLLVLVRAAPSLRATICTLRQRTLPPRQVE